MSPFLDDIYPGVRSLWIHTKQSSEIGSYGLYATYNLTIVVKDEEVKILPESFSNILLQVFYMKAGKLVVLNPNQLGVLYHWHSSQDNTYHHTNLLRLDAKLTFNPDFIPRA
jgi:uncharacterized cupin superfamily protein